jgi:hypothetical protein
VIYVQHTIKVVYSPIPQYAHQLVSNVLNIVMCNYKMLQFNLERSKKNCSGNSSPK